ncbi:JDVT-CTERM system glutamic-type intramembrane protease MrtJ [Marinobacter sp.]|uniref:JDVT-CTERM system glutamic-type intramembrane protease MrtJ n=1 Tax=Marinobacter sp. TaxID=50741 RepID=UPI003562D2B7
MRWLLPGGFAAGYVGDWMALAGLLLVYPVVEEVLFRGVIQGELLRRPFFACSLAGISAANVTTSGLFVLLHLFHQPLGWALAVAIPSLVLGYFRERYQGVWMPIFLHVLFNGTYLVAGI